ncbi:peptidoglycan DD-metalloendopeptidase family protein [Nannocystaceae bacterium ST9]
MQTPSSILVAAPLLLALACIEAEDGAPTSLTDELEPITPDSADERTISEAVVAQNDGDFDRALELYAQLEDSPDPWYAWAGTSGQVAVNRVRGDFDAARAITAGIRAKHPERTGLSHLWDGDTAVLEGNHERALVNYRVALDDYADEVAVSQPLGVSALRQISRLQLGGGDPAAAAATLRELVGRYPGSRDAEFDLASAIAFDAMADGTLPISPLGVMLHDGECTIDEPCDLASRDVGPSDIAAPGITLAGLDAIRFVLGPQDEALHQGIADAEPLDLAPVPSAAVCVAPAATSGFNYPLANDHSGYVFMEFPDSANGYHPGLDINGPGGGNADCGLTIRAASVGCVTDSTPIVDWGAATIQSLYSSQLWTQQYGHASTITYSPDSAVAKNAPIGTVGKVGAATCHLHFEIRESDHPSATNASYYGAINQTNVGDFYQNPFPFIDAQRSYVTHRRVDEQSFTFVGAWTPVAGIGNEDDMRYALTTAANSKTNYARYTFTPTSTRTHQIYAFVPWNNATSTAASVKLMTGGNAVLVSKAINQGALYDAWVYVGQAALTANTPYYLEVASNTGEANRRVGIDDFLLLGI